MRYTIVRVKKTDQDEDYSEEYAILGQYEDGAPSIADWTSDSESARARSLCFPLFETRKLLRRLRKERPEFAYCIYVS